MVATRILIVEDEALVARDIQVKVENLGYQVSGVAYTGQEAVEQARDLQPDLVLMDIRLRGPMDGVQAAEIIREECSLPLIYVTALGDDESLRRAQGTGPAGYLHKPFDVKDLQANIEVALNRHAAELTLRHRLEMEALVADISGRFIHLSPGQLETELENALASIGQFLDLDRSFVALVGGEDATVERIYSWIAPDLFSVADRLLGLPLNAFPWFAENLRQDKVVHVPRVAEIVPEAAAEKVLWEGWGIQSVLALPMRQGQSVFGFLAFTLERQERSWSDEDIRLLELVGQVFSGALARQRVETSLQNRNRQLETLREISLELTSEHDLDALLESISLRAVELVEGAAAGFSLHRPQQDQLEWTAPVGSYTYAAGHVFQLGEGLSGRVWASGQPLIVNDYPDWEGKMALPEGETYAWTAIVGVPVRWGEDFLGVLVVMAEAPRVFSERDAELLSLFANQAAIAISNAKLLRAEHDQRELAEALVEAATVVSSSLELEQVLDHILEQVRRVVPGDAFNIMLIQDGVARSVRWQGYQQFDLEEYISTVAFPVKEIPNLHQMQESGEPVLVRDVTADPDWVDLSGRDLLRSYVAAPIRLDSGTVGFLSVDGIHPRQFESGDVHRMVMFAAQAANAIRNARLYEQTSRDATTKARLLREANHRVKNNLAAIIGLLYVERQFVEGPDQESFQALIETLSGQMQSLSAAHSVLSASEWSPVEISALSSLVVHSALQHTPHTEPIFVDVESSLARMDPHYVGDLALVINELTSNCIKHALPGRESLRIWVDIVEEGQNMVRFALRDNGPGYPPDVLDSSRQGAGLFLVRNVVSTTLQGEVFLQNDDGAVTTLRLKAAHSFDSGGSAIG